MPNQSIFGKLSIKSIFMFSISCGFSIAHGLWSLGIYIVTLVFSTFWVQNIFDFLMTEKIKNMKEIAQKTGDKEAISVVRQLELIKFKCDPDNWRPLWTCDHHKCLYCYFKHHPNDLTSIYCDSN